MKRVSKELDKYSEEHFFKKLRKKGNKETKNGKAIFLQGVKYGSYRALQIYTHENLKRK